MPPRTALGCVLLTCLLTACAPAIPQQPATSLPVSTPSATTAPAVAANASPSVAAKPAASPVPASAVSPSPALALASPSVAASPAPAAAAAAAGGPAPAGSATHGQLVFQQIGCYACHGTVGQGASTGPRLAPGPLPFAAFQQQVRQPRQDMPRFAPDFLSDQDLADIYAYVASIQPGPAATTIPLLNR